MQCKREAEECRRKCIALKAPVTAKCTALASLTGPLVSNGLSMEGFENLGAVVGASLAALSPYCEGSDACAKCKEGRGLRDLVTEIKMIYKDSQSQLKRIEGTLTGLTEQVVSLDEEIKTQMNEVTLEIGLKNVYLRSWLDLASLELVYDHITDGNGIRDMFVKLISRPKVSEVISELEMTFFEMIAGKSAYIRLAPKKFCKLEALTSLQLAQTKVRELFVFEAITKNPDVETSAILEDFKAHQLKETEAIEELCGIDNELRAGISKPDPFRDESFLSGFSDLFLNEFVGDFRHRRNTNYSQKALNEQCREICEFKVNELSIWCETVGVFGASLMCATAFFSPPFGCTFGSAISSKAALAALCASGVFLRSCELCGETVSFDDILDNIDILHRDAAKSISNGTNTLETNVQTLREDFLGSMKQLKKFYHVTQAYGKFMHKVGHLDTLFERIKRDRFGRPVKSMNYDKFFHENTLLNIVEAITEFHILLVGSKKYPPFEMNSIFEFDPDYCQTENLCTLEKTQFGLIEKLFLVSNHINYPLDDIKPMIKSWREQQETHIQNVCHTEAVHKDMRQ